MDKLKDANGIFKLIKRRLLPKLPVCKWYAHGSRTRPKQDCTKCDFDIILAFPKSETLIVKFLQDTGVYGSSAWKAKALQNLRPGRGTVTGWKYYTLLFNTYLTSIKDQLEAELKEEGILDEFGNVIQVDFMVQYYEDPITDLPFLPI